MGRPSRELLLTERVPERPGFREHARAVLHSRAYAVGALAANMGVVGFGAYVMAASVDRENFALGVTGAAVLTLSLLAIQDIAIHTANQAFNQKKKK